MAFDIDAEAGANSSPTSIEVLGLAALLMTTPSPSSTPTRKLSFPSFLQRIVKQISDTIFGGLRRNPDLDIDGVPSIGATRTMIFRCRHMVEYDAPIARGFGVRDGGYTRHPRQRHDCQYASSVCSHGAFLRTRS
jgi:hypothetical protein